MIAVSCHREKFNWHQLLEEGDQKIIARAVDCLMVIDARRCPGLFRADEAPSLLNFCHSLGHRTLAMQLALGMHIDELAAPYSVRQVDFGRTILIFGLFYS